MAVAAALLLRLEPRRALDALRLGDRLGLATLPPPLTDTDELNPESHSFIGQLAEDLINQFKKKCHVFISARNSQKVAALAKTHNIDIIEWKNYDSYKKFAFIANTIGTDKEILFNESFFSEWKGLHFNKTFVDLGSTSCISTPLSANDDVLRLKEIFSEGAIHEEHKLKQIEKAKIALNDIVSLRHKVLLKRAQKAAYCS